MTIELKLDTSRPKKSGFPLVIRIYKSKFDKRTVYTGYYSTTEEWDFTNNEPKSSHPMYLSIMNYILGTKLKIIKILNELNPTTTSEQVKNILFAQSTGFYGFWESRIKEFTNQGQKTINENVLKVFKDFRTNLDFKDIDYTFLQSFKVYKKKTCTDNAINTYLTKLRAIYNEGIRRGLYQPTSYISPFNKIMEKTAATKDKYFTSAEIKKIVSKKEKTTYDYYFLLCFYLGGLDFIDIAMIKKSHIKKGRIKFIRHKGNTNEIIDNKIFPEAQEILEHFHDSNSDFLTPISSYKSLKTTRENYINRYRPQLKELEIESYFTSKTPRYSFIHIGNKELQLNREVIKELVGHAKGDTHSIYEGSFSHKFKDEVHEKIIKSIQKDE